MTYVIDQKNCSCCHRCRVECPADAVRFKNTKYWIDPEKCTDCGHCVEVCHNACISNPDNPEPVPAHHERIHKKCDVVVIGGGAAGMAAAARAATLGAKVILLEKGHEIGGSAWYAHNMRFHYSQWHKAAGLLDTRDKAYEQFMRKTNNQIDGKLLRRVLDANVEMADWLISEHNLGKDYTFSRGGDGGPFSVPGLASTYVWEYNANRIDTSIGPGGNGWWFSTKLLGILEASGGEVLYKTTGSDLILDKEGKVKGVLAKDPGGEVEITCKTCVVTAGAVTRNKAIMDKMQPLFYDDKGQEPIHIFTCSRCTGDGVTMCEKIGADIDWVNHRVNLFGPARHPYPCVSLNVCRGGVSFNSVGELFKGSMGYTNVSPLVFQPGRYCWHVVDGAILENNIKNPMFGTHKDVVNINEGKLLAKWREVLAQEEECGSIFSADTLEGLAKKLGFDSQKFTAIISEHNKNLPENQPATPQMNFDEDGLPVMPAPVAKKIQKPPFLALRMKCFHENTIGGMKTDDHLNVLKNGKPIPGLYAAGDNVRGIMLPGDIGVQYIEAVISALTWAFNSGYVTGVEAAGFAKKAIKK